MLFKTKTLILEIFLKSALGISEEKLNLHWIIAQELTQETSAFSIFLYEHTICWGPARLSVYLMMLRMTPKQLTTSMRTPSTTNSAYWMDPSSITAAVSPYLDTEWCWHQLSLQRTLNIFITTLSHHIVHSLTNILTRGHWEVCQHAAASGQSSWNIGCKDEYGKNDAIRVC